MIRFIIIVALAIAAFLYFGNFDFSKFSNDVQSSIKNEKTIKAVSNERTVNYQAEQDAINNEN